MTQQHSLCLACSHALRQEHARQMSEAVGLVPLRGDELEQVAYAEEIRAYVLALLVPMHPFLLPLFESPGSLGGLAQTVAVLNQRADADFWTNRRMVLYEPCRVAALLIELQLDSQTKGVSYMDQDVVYFSLQDILPDRVLALHQATGTLIRLSSEAGAPRVAGIAQFTMKEVDLLLPLLQKYPGCCTYGMLLARYNSGNAQEELVEQSERWLAEAAGTEARDQQMRPVRNVLSRVRLKLQVLDLDVAGVLDVGYLLQRKGKSA